MRVGDVARCPMHGDTKVRAIDGGMFAPACCEPWVPIPRRPYERPRIFWSVNWHRIWDISQWLEIWWGDAGPEVW